MIQNPARGHLLPTTVPPPDCGVPRIPSQTMMMTTWRGNALPLRQWTPTRTKPAAATTTSSGVVVVATCTCLGWCLLFILLFATTTITTARSQCVLGTTAAATASASAVATTRIYHHCQYRSRFTGGSGSASKNLISFIPPILAWTPDCRSQQRHNSLHRKPKRQQFLETTTTVRIRPEPTILRVATLPEWYNNDDDHDNHDTIKEEDEVFLKYNNNYHHNRNNASPPPSQETVVSPQPTLSSLGNHHPDISLLQQQLQQQQLQIDTLLQWVQQPHQQPHQQQRSTTGSEDNALKLRHDTQSQSSLPLPPPPPIAATAPPMLFQPLRGNVVLLPPVDTQVNDNVTPHTWNTTTTPQKQHKLKTMLFIDGTWLYYSIYERPAKDCPLIQTYGPGWPLRYDIDWTRLPDILCTALQTELASRSRSSSSTSCPNGSTGTMVVPTMEWIRSSVYTSYKADTSTVSYRYKLFQDLQTAGYQVHMMETVGKSEKCVDIQLAVEIMHYATSTDTKDDTAEQQQQQHQSYDIALLLTGDKDFMPAMIRARSKGKQLGLISMRRGCNRALIDTAGLCDFHVIWLEDYLDQLFVPKYQNDVSITFLSETTSVYTLHKITCDFIRTLGTPHVTSRDLGRYLKSIRIGDGPNTLLEEMKQYYGGMFQCLTLSGYYEIGRNSATKDDTGSISYWVGLSEMADQLLRDDASKTMLTAAEQEFFQRYSEPSLPLLLQRNLAATLMPVTLSSADGAGNKKEAIVDNNTVRLPESLTRNYSDCTVPTLKAACREFGLLVSGTKPVLLARVQTHVEAEVTKLQTMSTTHDTDSNTLQRRPTNDRVYDIPVVDDTVALYLKDLVQEFLHAKGGVAGSRDVGRYLAANKPSSHMVAMNHTDDTDIVVSSALKELKSTYGNVYTFVATFPDTFSVFDGFGDEYGFGIALHNKNDVQQ